MLQAVDHDLVADDYDRMAQSLKGLSGCDLGKKFLLDFFIHSRKMRPWTTSKKYFLNPVQGLPSGFDLKYLALADRNIQVRFSLKVVWESWVVGIWPMSLWFG